MCKAKVNYQLVLDQVIEGIVHDDRKPRLLLHGCCAPCSSYVLEYLSRYFAITLLYYNPNVAPHEEFERRAAEIERLVIDMGLPVDVRIPAYQPKEFQEVAQGYENESEGGARCERCFRLRLGYAAHAALEGGYDYFTTTLSISPLKDAQLLNQIGAELARETGVPYLFSDFKKRNGYKRSIELSALYGLYRQDYCGCAFSKLERERMRSKQGDIA